MTFKLLVEIHISLIKLPYIGSLSTHLPIEVRQPKNLEFEIYLNMSSVYMLFQDHREGK